MKKAFVFCSHGLGDGILFLLISNNLQKEGYSVDTYHPFLSEMNSWFSYTNIKKYPSQEDIDKVLFGYDLIIINSDYSKICKAIKKVAFQKYKDKTFELHPSTCKGKNSPIGNWKFDFKKLMISNLKEFLEEFLKVKNVALHNNIEIPKNLTYRKHKNRVVIHPSSKDEEKNWPKHKFLKLALHLKKSGFTPVFILAKHEREQFDCFEKYSPIFNNIEEISSYIYESGYMIGNDSGIAHLASSLKIPTLTIFSTKRKERFWKPNFHLDKTVVSWPLINIKGLRLREKYWKATISVGRVIRQFKALLKEDE